MDQDRRSKGQKWWQSTEVEEELRCMKVNANLTWFWLTCFLPFCLTSISNSETRAERWEMPPPGHRQQERRFPFIPAALGISCLKLHVLS